MEHIDKITPWLFNPFTGTILFVIAVGYVVRAVPFIANKFIPLLGVLLGSVVFLCIAPLSLKVDPEHAWNWYVMLWVVGIVVSSFGWMFHRFALSYLEDWLRSKSPKVDAWFKNTADTPLDATKVQQAVYDAALKAGYTPEAAAKIAKESE